MNKKSTQGFTLIELLLVVVIIGILLAVIVPRAWRANVDSKYGLVRQNCTELAAFASQWAEQQIESQPSHATSKLTAYYNSLTLTSGPADNGVADNGIWVGFESASNWRDGAGLLNIDGRSATSTTVTSEPPSNTVEEIVPPERLPRNPFNGRSVFLDDPSTASGSGNPIPGAITFAGFADTSQTGNWNYYAFIFQGTDSTTNGVNDGNGVSGGSTFHAGMGIDLPGLRNGIFVARLQYEE